MSCDIQLSGNDQQTKSDEKPKVKPQEVNIQAGCITGCTKIERIDKRVIFHCQGCEVPLQMEAARYH